MSNAPDNQAPQDTQAPPDEQIPTEEMEQIAARIALHREAEQAARLITENLALAGLYMERDAFGRVWFLDAKGQPVARITPSNSPNIPARVRAKGQISAAHRAALTNWIAASNVLTSAISPHAAPHAWCVPLGPSEVFSPKGAPMSRPLFPVEALAAAFMLPRDRWNKGLIVLLFVSFAVAALTR